MSLGTTGLLINEELCVSWLTSYHQEEEEEKETTI